MLRKNIITPIFFNPDVSIEEEIYQAACWKEAQRRSEQRAKKLIMEWKQEMNPVKRKDEVTQEMIERAKEYPIANIIEINRTGFACCLWHDEKTASMKLTKHNRLHCYGSCSKSFDSIDTVRRLHGLSFLDAVKALQ